MLLRFLTVLFLLSPMITPLGLATELALPLKSAEGWEDLQFRHIPPNLARFSNDGLHVEVNRSASPLIFRLPKPQPVHGFHVVAEVTGKILSGPGVFPDDAYLRVGLVRAGRRRLSWMERQLAPEWIQRLYKLAPPQGGIDHILFFNLVNTPQAVGLSRPAPGSHELIIEKNISALPTSEASRPVDITYELADSVDILAVWLGMDGDDTGSSFRVHLRSLVLN